MRVCHTWTWIRASVYSTSTWMGLKRVNDSFGHDVGDQVLVEVANRVKPALLRAVIRVPAATIMADEPQ